MLDAIGPSEIFEISRGELGPVVGNNLFRNAMNGKQTTEGLNGLGSDISTTSAHFECASTTMKKDLSRNGPAKSMCKRCHGWLGQKNGTFMHGVLINHAELFCLPDWICTYPSRPLNTIRQGCRKLSESRGEGGGGK